MALTSWSFSQVGFFSVWTQCPAPGILTKTELGKSCLMALTSWSFSQVGFFSPVMNMVGPVKVFPSKEGNLLKSGLFMRASVLIMPRLERKKGSLRLVLHG